jgi:hypothetical protein
MRCEDYPCCGHTDGLPCDWTYTPEARAFDQAHALCDHEAGWCDAEDENEDDENDDMDEPFVMEDQWLDSYMEDRLTTMFE